MADGHPVFRGRAGERAETGYADRADYDLERLWRWSKAGLPTRDHPLAACAGDDALPRAGPVGRPVRLQVHRVGRQRIVGGRRRPIRGRPAESGSLAHQFAELGEMPVQLLPRQRAAARRHRKPRRRALHHAAGQGQPRSQDTGRVHRDAIESGDVPAPGEAWSAERRRRCSPSRSRNSTKRSRRGLTGKPVMWRLESDGIRADLESFLELDAENRARFGVSPKHVEAAFGVAQDGAWRRSALANGRRRGYQAKRGFIDRVDVSPDGSRGAGSRLQDGRRQILQRRTGRRSRRQGQAVAVRAYALAAERKSSASERGTCNRGVLVPHRAGAASRSRRRSR